jgi:hypothetical protein
LKVLEKGVVMNINNKKQKVKIHLFNLLTDTPARPLCCGNHTFNSKKGCFWCWMFAVRNN